MQNTKGAEFHPDLGLPETAIILSKGMDPRKDSYSAFQAEDPDGKSFLSILRSSGITVLYVGGLATDYCVRHTVIDALESGFKVKLLDDAIRGVDEKDSRQAIEEMVASGAELITFDNLARVHHAER